MNIAITKYAIFREALPTFKWRTYADFNKSAYLMGMDKAEADWDAGLMFDHDR